MASQKPEAEENAPAGRPRRSALYMPGTNARAHEKARALAADVLIFDFEDSVAPDAKGEAREKAAAALAAGGYGRREIVVRINGLDTPWGTDDLAALAGVAGIDAVLLPKVTCGDDIRRASDALAAAGSGVRLWCMMETARAILDADGIARADPRLAAMCMGLEDLAKELRADNAPPRRAMLYALERVVMAARAAGLAVLDAVYPPFDDDEGLAAACAQGRALGFDGKQLIHPRQIAAANAAFAPLPDEVAEARRVIEAFEAAARAGKGIAVLDGRMVEALHVAEARRLLAEAAAIAALDADSD